MSPTIATAIRRVVHVGDATKAELLSRLQTAGVQLNPFAQALFANPRFVTALTPSSLPTVEISVGDLDLPEGGTYDLVFQRALSLGLSPCPLEVGPCLRLQLLDQSDDPLGQPSSHGRAPPGSITVASQPISDNDDEPRGFYLRRVGGVLWLRGYRSWSGHILSPEDRLVFCQLMNAA